MNKHILNTGVTQINELRKQLWEGIYSDVDNMQSLLNHMSTNFKNTVQLGFNFTDSSLFLKSSDNELDMSFVNENMKKSYERFIYDMLSIGKINYNEYNECINNINMLYFITFIDKYNAVVKL